MPKDKSSGCLIVAIILLVLLALLAVPFLLFFRAKSVSIDRALEIRAQATATERSHGIYGSEEGAVILQKAELADFTIPKPGEEITRELLIAFLTADNATSLTRDTFRKVASEATVEWLLRTGNVDDQNGVLYGYFSLPWEIRDENGSTSSSISVQAEFTEESRESLLALRQGDWVPVKGELSFSADRPVLKNASLAGEPVRTGQ